VLDNSGTREQPLDQLNVFGCSCDVIYNLNSDDDAYEYRVNGTTA
jgi:hypothetical protein